MTSDTKSGAQDLVADFRRRYPAKPPRIAPVADKTLLITAANGRCLFENDPPSTPTLVLPPLDKEDWKNFCHLWIVGLDDVPYAPERSEFATKLVKGVLKHTNLSGGAYAHSGGEVFFLTGRRIFLNAASGRFGAQTFEELQAAAEAIAQMGYQVGVVAHDEELGFPVKIPSVEDEVEWFGSAA